MKESIFLISVLLSLPLWGNSFFKKSNPQTFHINIKTTVFHKGAGLSKTDLFLACFTGNEYQKCIKRVVDSQAKIVNLGSAGDSCTYYNLALGKKAELGKKVILQNKFTVQVFDVSINLKAIDSIYSYNKTDPNYKNYIGSNFPFINVEQKQLMQISDLIWESSEGVIDYARNCYLYVAKTFKYGLPLSGFKSLVFTLKNRVGDCGNLSSVFITLLRMKGIPARHLMGFRPDGSLHVWADFYLANYGWIPIDVTYKHDYPQGDYFGNIKFKNSGFIVQRGIGHEVSVLNKPIRITGLQTYSYQAKYSIPQKANVIIDRLVTCQIKN
ncbi:MAG: transglutaminase-like domain-containing protein [Crocinitomicaceae bacterium]